MASSDQFEIDVTAEIINAELLRTGIESLRRIQKRVEREARDLAVEMSIFAGGESDFVVVLDGPFEAEVELFSNDSPRTWLKIIRSVIEGYRESLDDDEIGDDGIGFIVPGPSDN